MQMEIEESIIDKRNKTCNVGFSETGNEEDYIDYSKCTGLNTLRSSLWIRILFGSNDGYPPFLCLLKVSEKLFASGSSNGNVIIWREENGSYKKFQAFDAHLYRFTPFKLGSVLSLIKLSEKLIASSSADKTIKLWREENGKFKEYQTLTGHTSYVSSLIKLSENIIVSGSGDKTLKIWKAHEDGRYREIQTLTGLDSEVVCLLKVSENEIASSLMNNTIKIWREENGKFTDTQILSGHSACVSSLLMVSEDVLASASHDKTIKLWNKEHGQFNEMQTLTGHCDFVKCLLKVSETVFASGGDLTIRFWEEAENGKFKEILALLAHEKWVTSLIKLRDNIIASGSLDKTIKLWRFEAYSSRLKTPVSSSVLETFIKGKSIKDFKHQEIKADGHCMYSSIVKSGLSGHDDVQSLRKEVANVIRNKDWFDNAIFAEHGCANKEMYALKVERMTPAQYGNDIDLAAFVNINGISVAVYLEDTRYAENKWVFYFPNGNVKGVIFLSLLQGRNIEKDSDGHFSLLLPLFKLNGIASIHS